MTGGPSFRRAVTGHALSATAQSLPVVALAVYVHEQTHSAPWVAAAAAVRLVPPLAFSAVAGLVGDRYDRRHVLIACNVGAAAITLLLWALAAAGAPTGLVLTVAFVAAILTTADYPAMVASTPSLVPPDRLAPANTVVTTVESAAFMVGPGLGGLLLAAFAPPAVFAAAALFFVAAAISFRRTPPWDTERRRTSSVQHDLAEGVRACTTAGVGHLVVVLLVTELLYGCTIVLLVLAARDGAHAGLLNACFAGGALAAVVLAGPLARAHRPRRILVASILTSGLPIAALAVVHSPGAGYALLAACGVASTVVEVQAKTLLQQALGDHVLARVFGLLDGAACAVILAGSALTPLLVESAGLPFTLVVVGAVLPAFALRPLAKKELVP